MKPPAGTHDTSDWASSIAEFAGPLFGVVLAYATSAYVLIPVAFLAGWYLYRRYFKR